MNFNFDKYVGNIYAIIIGILMPILLFKNFQMHIADYSKLIKGAMIYNVILVLFFEIIVFLIVNNMTIAGIFSSVTILLLSVLNMFVYYFRGRPISPMDLKSIRTAVGVASNYDLWLNDHIIIDLLYASLFIVLFLQCNITLKKIKMRLIVTLICLLSIGCALGIGYNKSALSKNGFVLQQFIPLLGVEENGYCLDFWMNAISLHLEKPADYSSELVQDIYDKYAKNTVTTNSTEEKPNIIVIMNESFSDLNVLGDISYSEDPLPFFNSLKENTVRGFLLSSVYGGNTPNSEYEFLTGNSMAFYPKDSIVYQQFLDEAIPSLVSNLKALDYEAIALHPYNAIFWKRNTVYPDILGFDEFLSIENLTNVEYVRDYASDKTGFDIIINKLTTKKKEDKIFLFNVTMQNHGGYYTGMNTITAPEINNPYVNEFLSLTNISDGAFEEFITTLESFDEPTIVCMFGDHQPRFEDEVYEKIWENTDITENEKEIKKHMIPFVIWANYDIKEQEIPITSIIYLAPMILNIAKVPAPLYYNYLLDLQKKYPAIFSLGYLDTNYTLVPKDDASFFQPDINTYSIIQYNYVNDKNNQITAFFQQ